MRNAHRQVSILLCCGLGLVSMSLAAAQEKIFAGTGPNQIVGSGARVVLMGNGRSTAGRVVRFFWRQVEGPSVQLRGANHSTATFVAPKVSEKTPLKFQLTVADIYGGKGTNVVTVTVEPRSGSPTVHTSQD